jgi:ABC-2 type transport system permease protein
MISLWRHEMRLRRRILPGWMMALSFFSAIYMVIYTALPDAVRGIDPQTLALLKSLGVQTLATFEGFILATEFNVLPLIAGLFGIFLGISALVGEEDDGTLELLAALPVSRMELILAKTVALVIAVFTALAAAGLVAMGVFIMLQIDTPVRPLSLFGTILSTGLIAFVFLTLSLFLGAYLPNRGAALAGAMGALLVSFFGENLAGMAPVLDPCRPFFPFSYFKRIVEMLTGDIAWKDIWILLSMGMGFLILAVLSFQRRSLTVRAWPWQRPRPAGRNAHRAESGSPADR